MYRTTEIKRLLKTYEWDTNVTHGSIHPLVKDLSCFVFVLIRDFLTRWNYTGHRNKFMG